MYNINKLLPVNFSHCFDLMKLNQDDLKYFKFLGWNSKQFEKQFFKDNFYGLGLFFDNKLKGFVIGDIINIDNIIEYEILLIYIDNEKRNLGYASKLLSNIYSGLNHRNLKKIYLEVASNNYKAIKLYTKNGYNKTGTRKKYYNFTNKKIDALLYEKTINDTIKS